MNGEYLIVIGAVLGICYGVFKYTKAEETDFKKLVSIVTELKGEIKKSTEQSEELEEKIKALSDIVATYQDRHEIIEKEFDSAQEHMAKLRASQIELRDRSYPRTIEFKVMPPSGPIPVEIYSQPVPTKQVTRKAFTKTKSGYNLREEKRVSKLSGDPDKYQWPKSKEKVFKKVKKQIEALSQ